MSYSQVDAHAVQIAHLKSEILILKLLQKFPIIQVSDKFKQAGGNLTPGGGQNVCLFLLPTPSVSCVSAVQSPYTVSCLGVKRLHSLHLCCWL